MKIRVEPIAVDTLNRVCIERYAESVADHLADGRGEMEPVRMSAPGRGYYGPIFRIIDKSQNEIARCIGKHLGDIGRLFNLAERYASLGALELREIYQIAELMNSSAVRQITKRDIPTFQPWP